jgi:hypothetical protein
MYIYYFKNMFYNWILCFCFTNLITYKRQIINNNDSLKDILHFDDMTLNKKICDIFPLLCILLIENYEKYIICHTYLLLIRFICFNVTILPAPMKLEKRMVFGIIPSYTHDLIFSGHTMTCVLSIFCVKQFLIPYVFILSILCSLSVIIAKEHYTIDVIVAWISTYSVVSLYTIDIIELC